MDRRSFFKRLTSVAATIPLFKVIELSAEEEKKIEPVISASSTPNNPFGLFTKEELVNVGFIPVEKPCFVHEGNAYAIRTYKLNATWSAELEQDLRLHGLSSDNEIKAAILNELKDVADKQGAKHRFIMNAYKHTYILPEDFTPRFFVYVRMCLI